MREEQEVIEIEQYLMKSSRQFTGHKREKMISNETCLMKCSRLDRR